MGNFIVVKASGHVYCNPKPHLRTVAVYHPSLVLITENAFTATLDLGQAGEALDYHTVVAHSVDAGHTWNLDAPLILEPSPSTTHTIRTTRLADGSLVGLGGPHHRIGSEEGLVNRATFGFVPVDLFLVRSSDSGRSWSSPSTIVPPLTGPSWEICHSVVELSCGRWLAPTATWRGWNGDNPLGEMAVVLISDNAGYSWPAYGCSFNGRETGLSHLEQSVVQLADGRILALSWVFEADSGKSFPTEYSLSSDRGETFSAPFITGFIAQTRKVIQLSDGRLLCAYRRNGRPGLWTALAKLEGKNGQILKRRRCGKGWIQECGREQTVRRSLAP